MARNTPPRDSYLLFSKSAGVCNLCKKYVPLIAQQAHIIAHSSKGPRGNIPYEGNIDSYDNLILLCPNCHTEIDNYPENYSVKRLRDIKLKHEKNIQNSISNNISNAKLDNIWVIQQLIYNGYLYELNRFIKMLPKLMDIKFFDFFMVFDELKEMKNIYPVSDHKLQKLLEDIDLSAKEIDKYISGYVEYRGRRYNNFDSPPESSSRIYRVREGLPWNQECQIDQGIENAKIQFLDVHEKLILYIRKYYPELASLKY